MESHVQDLPNDGTTVGDELRSRGVRGIGDEVEHQFGDLVWLTDALYGLAFVVLWIIDTGGHGCAHSAGVH